MFACYIAWPIFSLSICHRPVLSSSGEFSPVYRDTLALWLFSSYCFSFFFLSSDEGAQFPSLRELDQLPGVATVWYRLGLQLEVKTEDLDVIEMKYRDADMCKIKMFAEWLRCDTNPTYKKLVVALLAVGKRNLAESVCSARGE